MTEYINITDEQSIFYQCGGYIKAKTKDREKFLCVIFRNTVHWEKVLSKSQFTKIKNMSEK